MTLENWIRMGLTTWLIPLLLGGGCLSTTAGCAFIKPTTELAGPGWHFVDTKNNDIEIVNLNVDPETKAVHADSIVVRNNASDVVTANVAQMMAFVEQQRAANEGIREAFVGITNTANALSGALLNLPTVRAAIRADGADVAIEAATAPCPLTATTQPSG